MDKTSKNTKRSRATVDKMLAKKRKRKVNASDMSKAPSASTTGVGFNVIPSRSMNSGSQYHSGSGV